MIILAQDKEKPNCPARIGSGQRLWFVGFCTDVGFTYLLEATSRDYVTSTHTLHT